MSTQLTELAKNYLNTLRSSGAAAALPVIDQMLNHLKSEWESQPPESRLTFAPYYSIIEVVLELLEPRVHSEEYRNVASIYYGCLTKQVFTPGVKMGVILATYEAEKVMPSMSQGQGQSAETTTVEAVTEDNQRGDDQIKERVLAGLSPLKRQVVQDATFVRYGNTLVISGPSTKEIKRLSGAIKKALPWCDEVSA